MNSKYIKTSFYYGMIALLGLIFLISGVIFQNNGVIFQRMIRAGSILLAVGIIFLFSALRIQNNEKNNKKLKQLNNVMFDERNQLIAGKSASITIDLITVFSILVSGVFYFLGMNNYANLIIGYVVISSILRIIISIFLRHRL